MLETNPEALAIAKSLDEERNAGRVRGPLHGVPILLTDNIATGDRMATTAGSLMMEGQRIALDAVLVMRLRRAGAVILGKTNLSEWANFRSSNSISGWSSRGGQTLNPYAPGRSPSGSSSGPAVAVAANLCAAAIGTETDGSIVSPSACNNIVGFKPTLGLVSRTGMIPIALSQDTGGPMARSVRGPSWARRWRCCATWARSSSTSSSGPTASGARPSTRSFSTRPRPASTRGSRSSRRRRPLTDGAYVKALAQCRLLARTQGIDAVVKSGHIDAIVAPTTSPPWMIDPVTGDSGRGGCASLPAVAGYPHLTVPAGFIRPAAPFEGVAPVGISFFGPAFSDAKLLAIGHVFEQATKHRRAAPV